MRVRISRRAAVMGVGSLALGVWEVLRARDAAATLWGTAGTVVMVVVAALLHELGHAVAAWGLGAPIRSLRLDRDGRPTGQSAVGGVSFAALFEGGL